MKKFLVSVLLLIPFITSAQSTPQLQVSNLSTERYEYSVGQEIKGSFVLNNIGNSDIPDLQYYIAVGNYGEKGGILQNETTATPLSDVIYLPKTEKQNINFTIIPEKIPAGAMGLHVVIAQKNGMILGWSKIPLQITGTTQELITLEGSVVIDGIESPLLAGPTATKDSTAYVSLLSNQTGTKEFELVVYDRQFGQEIVYNQVVQAEFIDGEAKIPLPLDFKPESYAAEVKMLEGSNTVKFRYIVAGPQAEILSVNTDSLSLRENEAFVLKVSYADTPLNLDNPAATAYPENLSIKIKVFNQDGEMVDEYNGPLQSVLRNQLIEVDENSDEATLDAASNELDLLFNNAYEVEIPLTAHAKAKSLSFNVELYDSATGEIFDSYVTDFPAGDNQLMDVLLIVGALALIVVLVFIFVKTKHKIPTVCLALILTSLFSAHVIIQKAEALIVAETGTKNGDFVFSAPLSSKVGGYDPGEALPVDVGYTIKACANNGPLTLNIAIPKLNTWHSFTNAQQAISAITTDLKGVQNVWYAVKFNKKADDKYVEKYNYSSGGYNFKQNFSKTDTLVAPSTPGLHYLPIASWYCTSSHGCAKPTFAAYEICVNGAGVCPGETVVDACTNIAGNQAVVPDGYKVDAGICTPKPTCNDEHYEGQVSCLAGEEIIWSCELNDDGDPEYTGSWEYTPTGETCGAGLGVSCAADPITIQPGESTTFRSTVSNPQGNISYNWEDTNGPIGSNPTITRTYESVGSYLVSLDIEDDANNAVDSTSCRVTVSNCDNSHNGESVCRDNGDKVTWVCTASGWVEQVTGTCNEISIDPVVKKYEFNPNIVAQGNECKLTLEAENVSSCRLYKGGVDSGYNIPMATPTTINTTGVVGVSIGSYTLSCTGTGDNPTTGFYGTKQCASNFDIREN